MRTRRSTMLFALLTAGAFHTAPCVGEPRMAPPFAVKGLDGRAIRLSDFRGRPVVVDFWATWCAPCRASLPHLDALQRRYDSQGLVVIGFSVDEGGAQAVRQFAARMGVAFRMAMADEGLLDRYGPIRYLPTTFFIDRDGEIVRRVRGYIDPETMEAYVLELF